MGMEAYSRLAELRHVAQWFIIYAMFAPIVHGLLGFGLGYIAHVLFGFSPGGVIVLAIIASSNSDISGPPTLRAGIPDANPSSYIGASTSVGTPVALGVAETIEKTCFDHYSGIVYLTEVEILRKDRF